MKRKPAQKRFNYQAGAPITARGREVGVAFAPEAASCRVTVVRDRTHAVVRLAGELDFASMPLLTEALAGLLASDGPTSILVEAQQLEFADVAGLRPLLDLAERMKPGSIQVTGARRRVARVFQLLNRQGLLM